MSSTESDRYDDLDASRSEIGILLGVLTAVEGNAGVTQRSVAKDLGIALGLANAYVRRCIKKGFIKAQQVPANRFAYYLTPQGFAEKSRLTAEYLSQGFHFFRVARHEIDGIYEECERQSIHTIGLHGLTDLTEIAVMTTRDRAISISAIYDATTTRTAFGTIPIYNSLVDLSGVDAVIITNLSDAQSGYEAVVRIVPEHRIFVPKMLNVSRMVKGSLES